MLWMLLACKEETPQINIFATAETIPLIAPAIDTAACAETTTIEGSFTGEVCDRGPIDCTEDCLTLDELMALLLDRSYTETRCNDGYLSISFASETGTTERFGFLDSVITYRASGCPGCTGSYCCGDERVSAEVGWQYGTWPAVTGCTSIEVAP